HRRLCGGQRAGGLERILELSRHRQHQPGHPESASRADPGRRSDPVPGGRVDQGLAAVGANDGIRPAARHSADDPSHGFRVLHRSGAGIQLMAIAALNPQAALRRLAVGALALAVSAGAGAQQPAASETPFVVRDFRVEGAQGIQEGTIYNYLPINIGDTSTKQREREAIRALYRTGFFQDIELRRDGDTLVIAVLERPSIAEFTFSGNKDIPDEALQSSISDIGLARGKTFDRSVLDEVTMVLSEEYCAQGKYGARITPTVEDLPDNRVRISLEIEEGERAKIRQINIVGNESFSDKELLDQFQLTTGNLLSFIRDDNRYSKEALEGDLERL